MSWNGILFGAMIGFLLTRSAWGAVAGAIIGYMLDPKAGVRAAVSNAAASISSEFFRTTFEIMGYVAKSDGRVSEAEIDAARRVMQEFNLGPADVAAAIACFTTGKSAGYDAEISVERLRETCGLRYDLLRAFVDLQLRAALAGNGISPPARRILAGIERGLAFRILNLRIWRHRCARGRTARAPDRITWQNAMQSSRSKLASATRSSSRRIGAR